MNEIGEIIFSLILLGWAANTVYFVVGWARGEIVFRPKNTETIETGWICDIEFCYDHDRGKGKIGYYDMTMDELNVLVKAAKRKGLFQAIIDSDPDWYLDLIEEITKE